MSLSINNLVKRVLDCYSVRFEGALFEKSFS